MECVGFLGHHAEAKIASRTPRWYTLDEQKAHVLRYVKSRVMEEEDEDEVFSRRALDRVARGVARGERDAFRRDGENGRATFLHVNERSKMQKFLSGW